jgi:hypothetical protein
MFFEVQKRLLFDSGPVFLSLCSNLAERNGKIKKRRVRETFNTSLVFKIPKMLLERYQAR